MTEEWLPIIVVYLIGATVVAWIASSQGRSPLTWFGIAILLSPLFGFIGVILSAPKQA